MLKTKTLKFKKIDTTTVTDAFDCGADALNHFLKMRALVEQAQRANTTIVASSSMEEELPVGFYTILPAEARKTDLPKKVGRGIPYDSIPGWRIGRLAVDKTRQGERIGEQLLVHALLKALQASETFGGRMVIVDAKDESAAAFYCKYGFSPVQDSPKTLAIKLSAVMKAFA